MSKSNCLVSAIYQFIFIIHISHILFCQQVTTLSITYSLVASSCQTVSYSAMLVESGINCWHTVLYSMYCKLPAVMLKFAISNMPMVRGQSVPMQSEKCPLMRRQNSGFFFPCGIHPCTQILYCLHFSHQNWSLLECEGWADISVGCSSQIN